MPNLMDVHELKIRYGLVEVVHGVSLSIAAGKIVTIVGPNGAGKSTLLNALMGLHPSAGSVMIDRQNGRLKCEQLVRAGIVLITEKRDLFGSLSVEDNLRLGGFVRRTDSERDQSAALQKIFDLFPRLAERRRQLAETLSGGERQMLALGRALMSKPRLLMLDEPSLGLAPKIVTDVLSAVRTLADTGIACLLVEQNARAALKIADYAYVMETGLFVLEGPSSDVARDPRVIDSYLGISRAQ
jgi:branched-chain amino acid transport system ATP-binding protein